jgi:MFS transporter, LPLT family, lysophospholipid transporter
VTARIELLSHVHPAVPAATVENVAAFAQSRASAMTNDATPPVGRNYLLLLGSQFLAALGDNILLALIIGQLTRLWQSGAISTDDNRVWNAAFTMLPFIPGVLLAVLAGFLNDRFPKTLWLLGGNLIRLAGTLVALAGLWIGDGVNGRLWFQGAGYFIVGVGMCIYGPAKYGILPEILPHARLVKANGTVELLTIIAILAGPVTGAVLVDSFPLGACYGVLLGVFALSAVLNLFMTRTPYDPAIRLRASFGAFFGNFRELLAGPRLRRVLIGCGLFWICGATLKINFQPWGLNVLHLENNTQISLLGLWLGLGIIIGSVLAGQWHRVGELHWTRRYGWVLAGTIALLGTVGAWNFWLRASVVVPAGFPLVGGATVFLPVAAALVVIGALAGLFLIPLNAALQHESHPERLGKTIAAQNLVDYFGMILASGYVGLAVKAGLSEPAVFVGLAVLLAVVVTLALRIPPAKPVSP